MILLLIAPEHRADAVRTYLRRIERELLPAGFSHFEILNAYVMRPAGPWPEPQERAPIARANREQRKLLMLAAACLAFLREPSDRLIWEIEHWHADVYGGRANRREKARRAGIESGKSPKRGARDQTLKRLALRLRASGRTQLEVAEEIGVSERTIRNWERDPTGNPT
jgi:hypothetical protein